VPEIIIILIRSVIAFIVLLLLTRFMGKRQISHLTFFDYIVGITIGSIAAEMSFSPNVKILNGVTSLAVWGLFPIALAFIGLKSRSFQQLTDGRPSIIIKNGEVLEETMKKNQLTIDELMMLLREKSIFKISDIEMAVLETNGELSIMKKSSLQPLTPQLLSMTLKQEHAPTLLIIEGQILKKNLSELGLSQEWLKKALLKQGILEIDDVFLAQVDSNSTLFVDLYNEKLQNND
jgi:uncharacterized membrane protein YcaP (DUF421 family)